jgi:hypothetical protein
VPTNEEKKAKSKIDDLAAVSSNKMAATIGRAMLIYM